MAAALKELSSQFLSDRYGLMAFIYGLLRDPTAAEDIFQEVWVKLAEAAERGRAIDDMPAWCRGVARNLILRHWNEAKRVVVTADSELLAAVEQAFAEQDALRSVWQARRETLVACIRDLPGHARELLALKYEQGLTAATIAERLGGSVDRLFVTLSRLRHSLAECIERRLRLAEEQ